MNRWWVYQRERFPVFGHGPLVAAFSLSAVSFSRLLRGYVTLPEGKAVLVAFVTALLYILQLRIADEFKDFDEDSKYRPYRVVPRGLVTLKELGVLGAFAAAVQLGLALWLDPTLVQLLVVVWAYLALMSKEFFVGEWLKRHHVVYLISHMAILPLVDLYATACDWWPASVEASARRVPHGLIWFLIVSYFNGIVIEVGRKIRAPQDEEVGVNTYSALWGRPIAVGVWLGAMLATAACAGTAAVRIDWVGPVAIVLGILLAMAAGLAIQFLRRPSTKLSKLIETFSGVWTLLMYLTLGAVPLAWRWWRSGAGH